MQQLATRGNGGELEPKDGAIEIPDEAVVACPLVGFALAPVSRCLHCKVFAGLEDRFPASKYPFHKRYLLKCLGEPMKRQMQVLVKG
jgi:hypothetical protein